MSDKDDTRDHQKDVQADETADVGDVPRGAAARLLSWIDRRLWRDSGENFSLGRDLFLRVVGLAAFCASVSLALQVEALYGSGGILPFVDFLDWSRQMAAGDITAMLVRAPTLLWLNPSDGMLVGLGWTSAIAGLLLVFGVAPRLTIPVIWICYASILGVGRVFLSFQWDALLLETLVVAWFIAPWRLIARPESLGTSRIGRWLVTFLLFKLMFLSGWVKIASGDPAWGGDLDALTYHFWTQPLPTWTAYYVDRLPDFVLQGLTLATLVVELVVPFLLFLPRRFRHAAALSFIALQLGIAATGNYGFFNLLALALCLPIIDDRAWTWLPKIGARAIRLADGSNTVPPTGRRLAATVTAIVVLGASATGLIGRMSPSTLSLLGEKPLLLLRTTRSFNGYGLFAVMTKDRREISIELSSDGDEWEAVDFAWKPDSIDDRPQFIGPHMPRLDWQMWFAGLGECGRNTWLIYTTRELIEGNEAVVSLFETVPDGEFRYARFPSYQYRFGEDDWWTREQVDDYCPTLDFSNGDIRPADRL